MSHLNSLINIRLIIAFVLATAGAFFTNHQREFEQQSFGHESAAQRSGELLQNTNIIDYWLDRLDERLSAKQSLPVDSGSENEIASGNTDAISLGTGLISEARASELQNDSASQPKHPALQLAENK